MVKDFVKRKMERRKQIFGKDREIQKRYADKRKFMEAEMGGRSPEEFVIDPNCLSRFHNFMNSRYRNMIRETGDAFLDTAALGIFPLPFLFGPNYEKDSFGNFYLELFSYAEKEGFKEQVKTLVELAEQYSGLFLDFLRMPTVIVTSDVVEEYNTFCRKLRELSKQYVVSHVLRDKIFSPVLKVANAAKQNNEKHRIIEADPLVDKILGTLPIDEEISETDRRLLSMAIASGASDRRRKNLITGDKHINHLASMLYKNLRYCSATLDVSGLAGSVKDFDPFDLRINRIGFFYDAARTEETHYFMREYNYFDILNSKK